MEEINVVGLGSSFDYNKLKNERTNLSCALLASLKIDENNNIIYP